jgi:hypothetical protein
VKTSAVVATGKFDVKDDRLIITAQPVGTFNGTAYSGVTAMIAGAYAFGAWSGNGLTTTMPDAQAGLTTLAVASADQLGIDTFGGMSVAPSNVLVMYTYAGDANLDGTIDGGDYGIIDNFIQVPSASGYANGDFNYDGAIDGGDYGIIDNNIQAQGPPFPPSASFGSSGISGVSGVAGTTGITGVTAVPEPSACGSAFLAAATLLGRCRSRRRRDTRLW